MPATKGEANDLIEEAKLSHLLGRVEAALIRRREAEVRRLDRAAA
jgi:hypothetical protein